MDKKSNRTDLLAAGREKLRQYRQKRDNKGNGKAKDGKGSSRSANKADKSGKYDADVDKASAILKKKFDSSEPSEQEVNLLLPDTVETGVNSSFDPEKDLENSEGTSSSFHDADKFEPSAADAGEQAVLNALVNTSSNCELEYDVSNGKGEVNSDHKGFIPSASVGLEILHSDSMAYRLDSNSGTACSAEAVTEALNEPNCMPKGDKIVAMQGAENFTSKHGDPSDEVDMVRESRLSMSVSDGGSELNNDIQDNEITECDVDHETFSASPSVDITLIPVQIVTESRQKLHQEEEGITDVSSNIQMYPDVSVQMSNVSRCHQNEGSLINLVEDTNEQCDQSLSDGPDISGIESYDGMINGQNREESVCPGAQCSSINFCKLAEMLKQLSDDDFRHLIKSREMINGSEIVLPNIEVSSLSQLHQEQLYIINILKDLFHLQLLEQHEQQTDFGHQHYIVLDQVPVLTDSRSDFEERNNTLVAELFKCKSELEFTIRDRGELQNLYNVANQDVVKSSVEVDELKMKLEEALRQLSNLTEELVNSKVLFEVLHEENEKLSECLSSVTEQKNKFEEIVKQGIHENKRISSDLADTGVQIVELQLEITDLKTALTSANNEMNTLVDEKEFLAQEKEMLIGELADCKLVMTSLQQENAGLKLNLSKLTEEHNKLKEHEDFLSQKIERLAGDFLVPKDKNPTDPGHVQPKVDLKEAILRLEQLAEENIILQSSLEIHKAMLAEVGSTQNQRSSDSVSLEVGSKCHNSTTDIDGSLPILVKDEVESVVSPVGPVLDRAPLSQQSFGLQNDDSGIVALKGYLEEAEKMIQQVELAINGMHFQAVNQGHSTGQGSTAGVSKLIQAFESKANIEDHEPECLVPSDSYSSAKGNIICLRSVLLSLAQNFEHVNALLVDEKYAHKAADVICGELEVEIKALKSSNNSLEMRNIELEVMCGALNEYAHDIEANKIHLERLCEDLNQQRKYHELRNIKLIQKLADCYTRIDGLQFQLTEIRKSSDEVTSAIYNGVETLRKEVRDDIETFHTRWISSISELEPFFKKLDTVVGSAVGFPHYNLTTDGRDIFGDFSIYLSSACKVIEQLKVKLDATEKDYEVLSSSYMEANEKIGGLNEEHNLAISLLQKVSSDLVNLLNVSREGVEGCMIQEKECNLHDPLYYDTLLSKLESLLGDQLLLKESQSKLLSDLLIRTKDNEELKKRCLAEDALLKLVLDVQEVLQLPARVNGLDEASAVVLQSSVSLLIQKYKEAEMQVNLLTNDVESKMIKVDELHDHTELLDSLNFQQQNEIIVLKESLSNAKNALEDMQAELQLKVREAELSEQRVASVREKLSIAVAKGKGLVAQRDSLKQSLAEMSGELEKYSLELQLKESRIYEVEEKLKAYSEAGERMEALESELSYIRNSATALRESFVLKDSSLQRIEEILEDLELPEHIHSQDIIEKVNWLAKSVAGNSLLQVDWDQRNSVEAVSYSDAGLVVSDGCKEDAPCKVDDFRRKYDELQTKFYELAEQNDMLEQSLMERNILIQRWEEILDRINTPAQIRSMEPDERIHWLGAALSEADSHMISLQQKVENLEKCCGSLSVDLEESQRKLSEHDTSLQAVLYEKERVLLNAEDNLKSLQQKIDCLESFCSSLLADLEESRRRASELESCLLEVIHAKDILCINLVTLSCDHEMALSSIAQYENHLDTLGKEANMLQGKLAKRLAKEDHTHWIESEIRRLQGLILNVIQDSGTEDLSSDVNDIQYLGSLIERLMSRVCGIDSERCRPREAIQEHVSKNAAELVTEMEKGIVPDGELKAMSTVCEVRDIADLRRQLSEAVDEISHLQDERDTYMLKNQSLASNFDVLERKLKDIQDLLNQEEQKSASLREKLNLAVKKGKSVVQQRENLKQKNEEMSVEIEQLKLMISSLEDSVTESRQKLSELSLQIERYRTFESENMYLKDQLMETEELSQQSERTLGMFLNKLGEIDTGRELDALDPLQKLEGIANVWSDLNGTVASFELEAKKSKKAAELLLAELNEVQERNDILQEELARTYDEISSLTRERDLADSTKIEALAHLAKLSEEKDKQLAEMKKLNSRVHEVKRGFFETYTLANDVFDKDVQLLNTVRTQMKTCLEGVGTDAWVTLDPVLIATNAEFKDLWSANHLDDTVGFDVIGVIGEHLHQLGEEISALKDKLGTHSVSLNSNFEQLTTVISNVLNENASLRNSLQTIKGEYGHLESTVTKRERESVVMHQCISLLYEACTNMVVEIENQRAHLGGESLVTGDATVDLPALPSLDEGKLTALTFPSYENSVKTLADRLVLAVRDVIKITTEGVEERSREMRSTILDLQKELQDKDIHRERVCMELVSQIKEAKATAANYSQDLQSIKKYAQDLESKWQATGKERDLLEERVEELSLGHVSSMELGEKIKSLTDQVAAKEQEIEALMQALDEEENQMEALRSKIYDLEKVVEQKSMNLHQTEASRAKTLKKLAVTVSKFDELHHMSEGLLSEIENLQSQLQDRDAEVSFLRQEVTRCTNDALEATKMVKDGRSHESQDLLSWLDVMIANVLTRQYRGCDETEKDVHKLKELIQEDIMSIISELQDLRVAAQRKDSLLQLERSRVEELLSRKAVLEGSLQEKENQLNSLRGVDDSGLGTSEIVEVEPVLNRWTAPVNSTASQIRSLRKVNNDHFSIAIDSDAGGSGKFEEEDDDKVHGFKSLTSSRFIPKFTRPVSDMIDGLWVSCDRTLMRQPAFRLGIMIYWAVLHALLASFIV